MIYTLGLANDIGNAVFGGLRTLLMSICNFLYSLIITCLDLFEVIGKANIVDNNIVSGIYQRIGLILGIFMLFRLTFSFVQMMISPDQISDKEKGVGSLVKKVLVVIVALAFTPAVFTEAYNIQGILLDSHVVEKVILGAENNDNMSDFSPQFSYYIFSSFYKKGNAEPLDSEYQKICNNEFYDTALFKSVVENRNFDLATDCLNVESGEKGKEKIDKVTTFDGWTAILIGVFVLYVLVMYIITLGMRVAKLAFLQLVAPIPILSYLSPKKDTGFQKWISQCVSTFLDVFIRLAIITFGVLLMRLLVDNGINQALLESTGLEQGSGMLLWVNLILILGILLFIKKAPELLGEIFPSMGGKGGLDFGIGMKSRGPFISSALGAGVGAAVGAVGGFAGGKGLSRFTGLVTGAGGGLFRGGQAGYNAKGLGDTFKNSIANQSKANLARAQRIASGKTFGESAGDAFRNTFGLMSGYDQLNQALSMSNGVKDMLKGEDPIKHLNEVRQSYLSSLQPGQVADATVLKAFDDREKSLLAQMYEHSYGDNYDGNVDLTVEGIAGVMESYTESFNSNAGIHNAIKTNEKRSGKKLDKYKDPNDGDSYDKDNKELKTKIANKHKKI